MASDSYYSGVLVARGLRSVLMVFDEYCYGHVSLVMIMIMMLYFLLLLCDSILL